MIRIASLLTSEIIAAKGGNKKLNVVIIYYQKNSEIFRTVRSILKKFCDRKYEKTQIARVTYSKIAEFRKRRRKT